MHHETHDPARAEIETRIDGTDVTKSEKLEEEIDWPQLCEENARLQIPSFKKVGPLVSHGGSTFQRKRLPRELVREKKGPAEHVEKSGKIAFPIGEKAHLPQDVMRAIRFISKKRAGGHKGLLGKQGGTAEEKSGQMQKSHRRMGEILIGRTKSGARKN